VKIGNANTKESSESLALFLIEICPAVFVYGALQNTAWRSSCFLPTAAQAYAPLDLPPAALASFPVKMGNVKIRNLHRNVEVFLCFKHFVDLFVPDVI